MIALRLKNPGWDSSSPCEMESRLVTLPVWQGFGKSMHRRFIVPPTCCSNAEICGNESFAAGVILEAGVFLRRHFLSSPCSVVLDGGRPSLSCCQPLCNLTSHREFIPPLRIAAIPRIVDPPVTDLKELIGTFNIWETECIVDGCSSCFKHTVTRSLTPLKAPPRRGLLEFDRQWHGRQHPAARSLLIEHLIDLKRVPLPSSKKSNERLACFAPSPAPEPRQGLQVPAPCWENRNQGHQNRGRQLAVRRVALIAKTRFFEAWA